MGHIFISYSHKDTRYAHGLADHLKSMGFDVWIDERLDYGSQWPHEIQKQLDSCDAFLLIMTPRSFVSDWVQSELQRAKRKLKPIFPLLLDGEEPWLSVESTQYYDVRGGLYPDTKFYAAIQRVVSAGVQTATLNRLPRPVVSTNGSQPRIRMGLIVAILGAVLMALAACATMAASVWSRVNREPARTEPPIQTNVLPQATQPQPEVTSTSFVVSTVDTVTIAPTSTYVPTATASPAMTSSPTVTPTKPIPQEEQVYAGATSDGLYECPVGFAIAGIRLDRGQFLCRRVMREGEENFVVTVPDIDPITARYNMHACPYGTYLRAFNADQNRFLCSYDSRKNLPEELQSEFEDGEPISVAHDMHVCPESGGQITYLTGFRADENRFLCGVHRP